MPHPSTHPPIHPSTAGDHGIAVAGHGVPGPRLPRPPLKGARSPTMWTLLPTDPRFRARNSVQAGRQPARERGKVILIMEVAHLGGVRINPKTPTPPTRAG